MASSESACSSLQALQVLQVEFSGKAALYQRAEKKWRTRAFQVAVVLGILPVITGIIQLLPEGIRPWITLGIAVANVIVVVVNVKLDLGERIADSSMARKAYDKLDTQINLFLCQLDCAPQDAKMSELLIKIRTVIETVETNLSYPEAPLRRSNAVQPTSSLRSFREASSVDIGTSSRTSSKRFTDETQQNCLPGAGWVCDLFPYDVAGENGHSDVQKDKQEAMINVSYPAKMESGSMPSTMSSSTTDMAQARHDEATPSPPPALLEPPPPPPHPPPATLLHKVADWPTCDDGSSRANLGGA